MKRESCVVLIFVLSLAWLYPVALQAQYEGLESGTRLRISSKAGEGLPVSVTKGYLNSMQDDYLIFVDDKSNEKLIQKDQIIRLEQANGKRSYILQGFMLGILAGGVVGYIIHEATYTPPEPSGNLLADVLIAKIAEPIAVVPIAIGSVAGGVLGLFIGASNTTERWKLVPPVYPEAPIAGTGYAAVVTPCIGVRISF